MICEELAPSLTTFGTSGSTRGVSIEDLLMIKDDQGQFSNNYRVIATQNYKNHTPTHSQIYTLTHPNTSHPFLRGIASIYQPINCIRTYTHQQVCSHYAIASICQPVDLQSASKGYHITQ